MLALHRETKMLASAASPGTRRPSAISLSRSKLLFAVVAVALVVLLFTPHPDAILPKSSQPIQIVVEDPQEEASTVRPPPSPPSAAAPIADEQSYPEKKPATTTTPSASRSKYAVVTYLAPTDHEGEEDANAEDDVYLTSARLLAFQLLHDPETCTNTSIPFVVLVSPQVSQAKRRRLTDEGVTVIEFPAIHVDWMKPGRERWKHVMDKLNVFRLTQFEKVLLLDLDVVIFKRLDGVFELPETTLQFNRGAADTKAAPADEGPQPATYLLAADSSPIGSDKHTWPAKRNGVLNAGFVVLHPSEEAFQLNMKVASIEGRTPGTAPENNLWEYIYRKDGNMPFSHLPDGWIMNSAVYNDYKMGIAAVHEKWWRNSMRDKKLRDVLLAQRWRMDGYWTRRQN